MSDGGKGSSPRPYSVDQDTFSKNWDSIFKKTKRPDYYQDILSTEECVIDALDSIDDED